MAQQVVAVVELSEVERGIVNARKRVQKRFWTHKVCCGEYETFLTIDARPDLAQMVIKLWPEAFSKVSSTPHPLAPPVEKANRRYLISLQERFGDPTERRLRELGFTSRRKRSLLSRFFRR